MVPYRCTDRQWWLLSRYCNWKIKVHWAQLKREINRVVNLVGHTQIMTEKYGTLGNNGIKTVLKAFFFGFSSLVTPFTWVLNDFSGSGPPETIIMERIDMKHMSIHCLQSHQIFTVLKIKDWEGFNKPFPIFPKQKLIVWSSSTSQALKQFQSIAYWICKRHFSSTYNLPIKTYSLFNLTHFISSWK